MKITFKFNEQQRADVMAIATLMMKLNAANGTHANQSSTYGHLFDALTEYLRVEFGSDAVEAINNYGINWSGNEDWARDVEQAIIDYLERQEDERIMHAVSDFQETYYNCEFATIQEHFSRLPSDIREVIKSEQSFGDATANLI